MKCVYKIKCRDTNISEFYIGSSINFYRRRYNHTSNCNNINARQYNCKLYKFIRDNGGFINWEFEVIKEYKFISKKELTINEQAYGDLLKPELNSYNIVGIDLLKDKNTRKKKNSVKVNCPHCGDEMLKISLKRHIRRKHTEIV